MKCIDCEYYNAEEKVCEKDSWNDVNNPEADIYCDVAESEAE